MFATKAPKENTPCSEQFTAAILPVSGMPLENEADPLVLFSDPGFPSSDQEVYKFKSKTVGKNCRTAGLWNNEIDHTNSWALGSWVRFC